MDDATVMIKLRIGEACFLLQLTMATHIQFFGKYRMVLSDCMGILAIVFLVSGLRSSYNSRYNKRETIDKYEKILAIGSLIGSISVVIMSVIMYIYLILFFRSYYSR